MRTEPQSKINNVLEALVLSEVLHIMNHKERPLEAVTSRLCLWAYHGRKGIAQDEEKGGKFSFA